MKTPLAWRNFSRAGIRSLVIVCGVALAILLIFMQLGFRAAAVTSATSVQDALDFDILLVSSNYVFLAQPASFPRDRLEEISGLTDVASVTPVWVDLGEWRNISTRERWNALTLGVDPASPPFRDAALNRSASLLAMPDTALADRRIRPELGSMAPGDASEVEHHRLRIIGNYTIGAGFTAGATLVTGRETFLQLFPRSASPAFINMGLVRLRPGAPARAIADEMNGRLMPEVRALTRDDLGRRERQFWLEVKPVGIMFSSGVALAFIAGAVILYQIVASEVQNRLNEYATLKALGYGDRAITGFVLQQGLLFAILGFVPAFFLAIALYEVLRANAQVPVAMTGGRALLVLLLTLAMGLCAGLLAVRKLRRADPAELF